MANIITQYLRESDNAVMMSLDDTGLLTINGSLASNLSNGIATNATFRRKLTNITAAQLKALRATPISLIPAPGAGLFITPVLIAYRYNFLTSAFTLNAGTIKVFQGPVANAIPCHADVASGMVDQTANRSIPFTPLIKQGPAADANILNVDIELGNDGAAELTVGLGNLDVLVIYGIHTP